MLHAAVHRRSQHVRIGGVPKDVLLAELRGAGVQFNELGLALFEDPRFITASTSAVVQVAHVLVSDLGFPEGATFSALVERAALKGLSLCPLELGPHLRLAYLDQAEGAVGHPATHGRAPPGALTVASAPLDVGDLRLGVHAN